MDLNFTPVIGMLSDFLTGYGMLMLLVIVGIYFTLSCGVLQVTKFFHIVGRLFNKRDSATGGISPFQALTTALAASIGTGNIVGVAASIAAFGPGTIFWMWAGAFFGMATKYAEVVLAMLYRKKTGKDEWSGGAMFYIGTGLSCKWLAHIFCVFCIIASLTAGNLIQINGVSLVMKEKLAVPHIFTGVLSCCLVAVALFGGVKRIATVTAALVPVMSLFYIIGALWVIGVNYHKVIPSLQLIFAGALTPQAVVGGGFFAIMKEGLARGVFSNEAGLGSSPIVHAATSASSPVEQGFWGIVEVFVDTIVVCSLTALVILTAGDWQSANAGVTLAVDAFSSVLGNFGAYFMIVCVVLFAFSSFFGWGYYGEKSSEYLFGKKIIPLYRLIFTGTILLGAVAALPVWQIADTANGLMALPNLTALLLLSPAVIRATNKYFKGD